MKLGSINLSRMTRGAMVGLDLANVVFVPEAVVRVSVIRETRRDHIEHGASVASVRCVGCVRPDVAPARTGRIGRLVKENRNPARIADCRLVGWVSGWLADRSIGRSVGWSVGLW